MIIVRHKAMVHARCPVDDSWDYYEVEICADGLVTVEQIQHVLNQVRGEKDFQENITAKIAEKLGTQVITRGRHGTIDSQVEA